MIKITLTSAEDAQSKQSILKFSNDAPMKTEILPSIMKMEEFSCGSIIWIDTGRMTNRQSLKKIQRPFMVPLRRRNSGISDQVSDYFYEILTNGSFTFVNANGQRYKMTYEKTAETNEDTRSSSGKANSESKSSSMKVQAIKSKSRKSDGFAYVEGYVPKTASLVLL